MAKGYKQDHSPIRFYTKLTFSPDDDLIFPSLLVKFHKLTGKGL